MMTNEMARNDEVIHTRGVGCVLQQRKREGEIDGVQFTRKERENNDEVDHVICTHEESMNEEWKRAWGGFMGLLGKRSKIE